MQTRFKFSFIVHRNIKSEADMTAIWYELRRINDVILLCIPAAVFKAAVRFKHEHRFWSVGSACVMPTAVKNRLNHPLRPFLSHSLWRYLLSLDN